MSESQNETEASVRRKRTPLAYLAIVVVAVGGLWLTCVSPFLFVSWGWADVTRVSRYPELLAGMPYELRLAMPQSIPASAKDVRFHYHAGMLQGRSWLEIRFIMPLADAERIEEAAALSQAKVGDKSEDFVRSWLPRLATLDHRDVGDPPRTSLRGYVLAVNKEQMGFAAVAVDSVTGEVVYWTWSD